MGNEVVSAFVAMKSMFYIFKIGNYKLPSYATIFYALYFTKTINQPRNMELITNSVSTLQVISNPENTNRKVYEIKLTTNIK